MYKKVFFIKKDRNSTFRLYSSNKEEDQTIIPEQGLQKKIFSFKHDELIIHDIPKTLYSKSKVSTLGTFIHVNEAFGCSWDGYFAQFSYQDFLNSTVLEFNDVNIEFQHPKFLSFYNKLLVDYQKGFYLGGSNDYVEYTIKYEKFYDFLKLQYYPDIKTLNEIKMDIDFTDDNSITKLIFALNLYEGFANCSLLISDDILLDGLNLLDDKEEILIPFNLLKYLLKYKNIIDIQINKLFITKKQKIDFDTSLNPIEKMTFTGKLAERSDLLIRMYTRYYFLIFILKYFSYDVISVNLRTRVLYTYDKSIKSKLFLMTKDHNN